MYSGSPSSLYLAWKERAQGILESDEDYEKLDSITKGFIVIGNIEAGGGEAFAHVVADYSDKEGGYKAILLQAHEYGQISIAGNLIKEGLVQKRIQNFVERLVDNTSISRRDN